MALYQGRGATAIHGNHTRPDQKKKEASQGGNAPGGSTKAGHGSPDGIQSSTGVGRRLYWPLDYSLG